MKLKAVLFDLDGSLLPMDQNVFLKAYFGGLSKRLAPYGYEPKALIDVVWTGTTAMVKNDGSKRNEDAFWDTFSGVFGEKVIADKIYFDAFYREDFDLIKASCGYDARADKTIKELKKRGYKVALATNPIFPAIATEKRMQWAGLDKDDFELYTTYENARRCKPNPDYYRDILEMLGVQAEESLMVGNDVVEDMAAQTLGMKVFLLTDCLINKNGVDISVYPHGNLDDLLKAFDEKIFE